MFRTLLVIDDGFILITGLILFAIGYFLAWKTNTKWLFAVSGLLWFIPIFIIENTFIIIFSVVMLIFSGTLGFVNRNEE